MNSNFWDTGIEIISLIKEIWEEPTSLRLETLRVRMNETLKTQLNQRYEEEIIAEIQYTKEKLRFSASSFENVIEVKIFLYANFPQKLIKFDNTYVELSKYPDKWISSSEVKNGN